MPKSLFSVIRSPFYKHSIVSSLRPIYMTSTDQYNVARNYWQRHKLWQKYVAIMVILPPVARCRYLGPEAFVFGVTNAVLCPQTTYSEMHLKNVLMKNGSNWLYLTDAYINHIPNFPNKIVYLYSLDTSQVGCITCKDPMLHITPRTRHDTYVSHNAS